MIFQLFKDDDSNVAEHVRILADAGYQGLSELHENCQTPFKKSKYHPLTQRKSGGIVRWLGNGF